MLRHTVLAVAVACVAATRMRYELLDYESKAHDAATVVFRNARFTVLTDSLLRMEYSGERRFEDRPSLAFVNRATPVPAFRHTASGNTLTITTARFKLTYRTQGGPFSQSVLRVDPVGDSTFEPWAYGRTSANDPGNLRGTFRTLDGKEVVPINCNNSKVHHCEWGLVSRSGWALVDDTGVPVMDEDDWWADDKGEMLRNSNDEDLYLFAHSHRYMDALKDYTLVGGRIPIFPRNNHGVWYTRWLYYTSNDIQHVVSEYERNGLPLDVMVLDMNWHKKDDWSGYSWDPVVYPDPKDLPDFLHRRGITMAANLHDATGVGKWEDKYGAMCKKLGYDPAHPPGPKGIPFTLVNKSYVNALEDIVLKPIEDDGMDFWWIDWQQGEAAGGTGQDGPRQKMNPTIWTDKMRVTDSIRRCKQGLGCTNKRGVVLARWGGLGNHRYQHGFSGDVHKLEWHNLAYQAYFSATATNVGWGWWSHDLMGAYHNNEMYTRWLQLGAVSGIMRSHDRGWSAGGCAKLRMCAHVRAYNVPLLFRDANRDALLTRVRYLPYIYTQTRVAHETGVGLTRPMYYHWPEVSDAYPKSMTEHLGREPSTRQYMFGDAILAAPVTESAGCSIEGPLHEPCGVTKQSVWVPPGTWVESHSGVVFTGPSYVSRTFDINELPLYMRAGAVIPTIPVHAGRTLGLASQQYHELEFSIYPGAASGAHSVYEDDGASYDYLKGAYSFIAAQYQRHGLTTTFRVNTTGTFDGQPKARLYTVRLVNEGPATDVTVSVDGVKSSLNFSRWGGAASWSYDGAATTLVVQLPSVAVTAAVEVSITTLAVDVAGLRGVISRAVAAKRVLDVARAAPGHKKPDPKGAPLSVLAAMGPSLAYRAGHDRAAFVKDVKAWPALLKTALEEVTALEFDILLAPERARYAKHLLSGLL